VPECSASELSRKRNLYIFSYSLYYFFKPPRLLDNLIFLIKIKIRDKKEALKMRRSLLFFVLYCVLIVSSCQNLTTKDAALCIKNTFRLSNEDKIEIIGISKDSKTSALVKFKINDIQFNSKMRKYDTGWELEEIQNDFGLWIPASSISSLFDETNKVKRAMIDINVIATAIIDFVTDRGVAPEQAGSYGENTPFYKKLNGIYVKNLPIKDPWDNNYHVFCGKAVEGKYGIENAQSNDFLVVSFGKDGKQEFWSFDPGNPTGGLFTDQDYNKDLIIYNGKWIRGPKIEK